jgi:hypothetical protein
VAIAGANKRSRFQCRPASSLGLVLMWLFAGIRCARPVHEEPLKVPQGHILTLTCGRPRWSTQGQGDTVVFEVHRLRSVQRGTPPACQLVSPDSVTWSSSDTAIASVDHMGRVVGRALGSSLIGAFISDTAFSYRAVRVVPPVKQVRWSSQVINIHVGDSTWLVAYAYGHRGERIALINALGMQLVTMTASTRIEAFDERRGVLLKALAPGDFLIEARLGAHADTARLHLTPE